MRYCIDRAQPRVDAPPEDGCVGTRMTRRYVRELRKAACLTTARLLDVRLDALHVSSCLTCAQTMAVGGLELDGVSCAPV